MITIRPTVLEDVPQMTDITKTCVITNISKDIENQNFLIADILKSIDWWTVNIENCICLVAEEGNEIIGYILIKNFWNLSNLFVHPDFQKREIGARLLKHAIGECKKKSSRDKIKLNSSTYAKEFYENFGFNQTGPQIERLGGCIPFEILI